MPTLREVQRAVARGMFSADGGEALGHIAEDAIGAAERFAVHRNNAAVTLIGALRLTYPVVDKLVGAEFFTGAAHAFIARHPPRTACLNDYGAQFAEFLAGFPAAAGLAYLPDVARLEWAVNASLNAPDTPALAPAALAELDVSAHVWLRLVPHPAVTLLTLRYPADAIWRAVRDGDDAALAAIELDVAPMSLLVERRGDAIAMCRLAPDEAELTALLFSGGTLPQLAELEDGPAVVMLLAEHLAYGRFAGFEVIANSE
jgi:Putative DNA-binding domain